MWNIKHHRNFVLSLTVTMLWWIDEKYVVGVKSEKTQMHEASDKPMYKIITHLKRTGKILITSLLSEYLDLTMS